MTMFTSRVEYEGFFLMTGCCGGQKEHFISWPEVFDYVDASPSVERAAEEYAETLDDCAKPFAIHILSRAVEAWESHAELVKPGSV